VIIFSIYFSTYSKLKRCTHLAVLHDIQLSEPCLIKGIASRVNNMAESVLLCQDEHRVQEGLHRFDRLDKTGAGSVD
jgi:hypothetical protein